MVYVAFMLYTSIYIVVVLVYILCTKQKHETALPLP